MRLLTDCRLATMVEGGEPYGAIDDAALLIEAGRIVWAGPRADLPVHNPVETDRLDGRWVTPVAVSPASRPSVLAYSWSSDAARVAATLETMPPPARAISS